MNVFSTSGFFVLAVAVLLALLLAWPYPEDAQPYVEQSRCSRGKVEVLIREPGDTQRWWSTDAECKEGE